jgi:hypothetical protein
MRNHRMLVVLLPVIGILAVLTGCEAFGTTIVDGSGSVVSEPRQVGEFSRIRLDNSGELHIVQGDAVSVTIEAEDNLLPYLTTEVSGDELVLTTLENVSLRTTKPIIYQITVVDLSLIEINGSATIAAENLSLDMLQLDISGTGHVTLSGEIEEMIIAISGTGTYNAEALVNAKTTLNISGTGEAAVNASDVLIVDISGTAQVTYTGDPQVTQKITGTGTVKQK